MDNKIYLCYLRFLSICLVLVMSTGCQIIELQQDNQLTGEIEFSDVQSVRGRHFSSWSTAWYILDLGPVYEASIAKAMNERAPNDSHMAQTVITTEFHFVDVLWRLTLQVFIGLPVVATRSVYVDAVEANREIPAEQGPQW